MNKTEFIRMVKFTLFSISAGLIQTVSFTLMNELLQWNYWVCYLTALTLSVVWNFTLNRKFTFHAANNVPVAMLKVAAFYLVFTPLSTWGGQVLADIGWNEYIILVLSMLLNFVLEFLYDKYVVFRGSIDTAKQEV
jgi:putative flippase GtrA